MGKLDYAIDEVHLFHFLAMQPEQIAKLGVIMEQEERVTSPGNPPAATI